MIGPLLLLFLLVMAIACILVGLVLTVRERRTFSSVPTHQQRDTSPGTINEDQETIVNAWLKTQRPYDTCPVDTYPVEDV